YPAKAVVGERVPVAATVYREGHDALGADVVWRGPDGARRLARMTMVEPGTDRWSATIAPDATGRWTYHVQAWGDPYLTWKNAVDKKTAAGQGAADLANDIEAGARILDQAARGVPRAERPAVLAAAQALR